MEDSLKKKRGRPRKRSLSISETVNSSTQLKTKKKKSMDALMAEDWKVVERGTFLLNKNSFLAQKNSVFLAPRNSTCIDIFLLLFESNVVKKCFGDSNERVDDFYKYLSLRMIMHGYPLPAEKVKNPERVNYVRAMMKLKEDHPSTVVWGCRQYFAKRDDFSINEKLMSGAFSEHWSSLIRVGESLAFDEKQRTWRGNSMFIHMNRAKPEPIGHMVCMLTAPLEASSIPYTVGIYAYQTNKKLGIHISAEMLMKWATDLIERMHYIHQKPIIVNDCLYTTNASREVHMNRAQPFIAAQKPSWWPAMESLLQSKVPEPGTTAYAWSESKKLVVCCHFDPGRNGKRKYVVSNAFSYNIAPEYNKLNPPVYSEYAASFGACDQFNMRLSKNWYPYRSSHWEIHFEAIFLSMAFMNFYAICRHLLIISDTISFKDFLLSTGYLLAKKFFS